MTYLAELLGWWFLAVVKFLFLPWLMIIVSGKSYLETVLVATSGAAIGIFGLSFIANRLFKFLSERDRRKGKRQVTPTRRKIVGVKKRFGLKGLILISALISVPVTTLLATKYFNGVPYMRLKLVFGFFLWANLLSLLALFINYLLSYG
jgi:hypothetical protein